MPFKILDHQGKVIRPDLGDGDPLRAFEAEIAEVARSIRSKKPSPILSGELASDAITLCYKQSDSVQKGRPVRVCDGVEFAPPTSHTPRTLPVKSTQSFFPHFPRFIPDSDARNV
jgi:hypothetical protein